MNMNQSSCAMYTDPFSYKMIFKLLKGICFKTTSNTDNIGFLSFSIQRIYDALSVNIR